MTPPQFEVRACTPEEESVAKQEFWPLEESTIGTLIHPDFPDVALALLRIDEGRASGFVPTFEGRNFGKGISSVDAHLALARQSRK
jgi:hypothetical protein